MKYALGDVNVTMLRTHNDVSVTLYHDTSSPRPYNFGFRVQGTNGIYLEQTRESEKIYIEGRSPESHKWEDFENYKQYEHPLWSDKKLLETAAGHAHEGGDYMQYHRLVEVLRTGAYPDMDVYDAATWSVISALTERSVANKSRPVDFPDFTRGKWKTNPPVRIMGA
jgi:hypothetical protein